MSHRRQRIERIVSLAMVFAVLAATSVLGFQSVHAQAESIDGVSAKRYIVIDAETGEVFAEHNADEEAAMASLTKIFTTIEALERGTLDEKITTNDSDLYDWTATTMGFGPGETFTLKDLLYGMMLPSGNDAAHAIARALGYQPGDSDEQAVQNFVDDMNQRIVDMGLTHTQLKNPHGWGVEGHYSTVRDLAAFTMYALQYPMFQQLIGTADYTTSDGYYYVVNTNKLLNSYSGLIGGKTGYDDDAGYCLIEVASRDGSTMISVTLDGEAPDIWYQDNAILLDYAFATKAQRIAAGKQISGDVVRFRDPDAAQILASSKGGNSLGLAPGATPIANNANPEATVSPVADIDSTAQQETGAGSAEDSGANRNPLLIGLVALISIALAAFFIWKAMQASGHRPDRLIRQKRTPDISPPD